MVACRGEHVERAQGVHLARSNRILDRTLDGGQRRLVEDEVDAQHRSDDLVWAPDVSLHDLQVGLEPSEVRPASGREVVENSDRVATLQEASNEVRADEAGATGD